MNDQLALPALAGFLGGAVAAALPRIDLLPEEVGLGTVFALAGAGATIGLLIDYTRGRRDDRWLRRGTALGFGAGLLALVALALVRAIFYP